MYYWVKRLPKNNTISYTSTHTMQNTHHQQVVKAAWNVSICIALQIKHKGINCSIFCMTILYVYTWNNMQNMNFSKYNLRKLKCECFQKKIQGWNSEARKIWPFVARNEFTWHLCHGYFESAVMWRTQYKNCTIYGNGTANCLLIITRLRRLPKRILHSLYT